MYKVLLFVNYCSSMNCALSVYITKMTYLIAICLLAVKQLIIMICRKIHKLLFSANERIQFHPFINAFKECMNLFISLEKKILISIVLNMYHCKAGIQETLKNIN